MDREESTQRRGKAEMLCPVLAEFFSERSDNTINESPLLIRSFSASEGCKPIGKQVLQKLSNYDMGLFGINRGNRIQTWVCKHIQIFLDRKRQ